MKSELIEAKPKPAYPALKATANRVILFTEPKTGTIVHEIEGSYKIGYYCTGWAEDLFAPFTGTITLQND